MAQKNENLIDDLRESIKDYRNPKTRYSEMKMISEWWSEMGLKNQFQAALKISELKKEGEK